MTPCPCNSLFLLENRVGLFCYYAITGVKHSNKHVHALVPCLLRDSQLVVLVVHVQRHDSSAHLCCCSRDSSCWGVVTVWSREAMWSGKPPSALLYGNSTRSSLLTCSAHMSLDGEKTYRQEEGKHMPLKMDLSTSPSNLATS